MAAWACPPWAEWTINQLKTSRFPREFFFNKAMLQESEFKEGLIKRLNSKQPGWIDGDQEIRDGKTADIVNHIRKVAIEVKDDTRYKLHISNRPRGMSVGGHDLGKMNERYSDHVRSANRKFKQYAGYKTILLFRTEFPIFDVIRYSVEGLYTYSLGVGGLVYSGRRGKYSKFNRKEIGCFLLVAHDAGYFPNVLADSIRVLSKKEVEEIFGWDLEEVAKI